MKANLILNKMKTYEEITKIADAIDLEFSKHGLKSVKAPNLFWNISVMLQWKNLSRIVNLLVCIDDEETLTFAFTEKGSNNIHLIEIENTPELINDMIAKTKEFLIEKKELNNGN